MPNLHDIERRISSVSSTKQITRTMEMVAAAKIRRASERVANALPWAMAVSDMMHTTAEHAPIDIEPLLQTHDVVKKALCDAGRGRDMSVYGARNKFQHVAAKLLPQRVVMNIWQHRQKLK